MYKDICPYCKSRGLVLIRRGPIRRAFNQYNRRRCIDCGRTFSRTPQQAFVMPRYRERFATMAANGSASPSSSARAPRGLEIVSRFDLTGRFLDAEYYIWSKRALQSIRMNERGESSHRFEARAGDRSDTRPHAPSSSGSAGLPFDWGKQRPTFQQYRPGAAADVPEPDEMLVARITALEKENEILRKAAAYFAKDIV